MLRTALVLLILIAAAAAGPKAAEAGRPKYLSVLAVPPTASAQGYGFPQVPAYHWGWFGAEYRPHKVAHKGFYNDAWQLKYKWGY